MYLWLIKYGNDEAGWRWVFTTILATIITECIYVLGVNSTGINFWVFQMNYSRKN